MTLLILDGNNLAMRSFHAAKGSMSSAGEETGSLQLFVNSLSMYTRAERPTRMVVCWDSSSGSTLRKTLYPEYKAARRKASNGEQPHLRLFSLIQCFLELANVPQCTQEGVEGDDLIAAYWRRYRHTEGVVILSSDKDLLQLLDGRTAQVRFSSYNTPSDRWTRDRFITEYGYRPEQLPLVMALMGDAGDGVPGMRGIGPKKALRMLQAADWDLDKAMAPHRDQYGIVMTSRALVDLSYAPATVPELESFSPTGPTDSAWAGLLGFCASYQLRTIQERLTSGLLWDLQY